ncbi:SLC13 family permease [Halanaerobium kushneri]|uniref:Sodium-dependent dicarboxylate transporter SdcS n=1 Tax=Halanaerobium kushneri TaxID=56779 RepID=A0A1N6VPY8_9FIRM|nr:SLC13 family permease [Halanaerobium kushneri]SIQ79877.1 anion transporter [Halanaerobium kushneri]
MVVKIKDKRTVFLFIGIAVALLIWNLDLPGLSLVGRKMFSITLMTVIFWAAKVADSAYVAALFLMLMLIFEIAPAEEVLSLWTSQTVYLVIGAYLIAAAVEQSGLGERIAYKFIIHFVDSYRSIIVSIFALTFLLSLIIPHPWPRAFIIMSVMSVVIENAGINKKDASKIGLTVFAASIPISMIFLTGESTLNFMTLEFAGVDLSWGRWFLYMGAPAALAALLTMLVILKLFQPDEEVEINKKQIGQRLLDLGMMSAEEQRTVFWLIVAVVLWMTDSFHGVELGWLTLTIAVMMSLPVSGDILKKEDWNQVPIKVLIFLTAAVAIGKVGSLTGMNQWLAEVVLPAQTPNNMLIFALMTAGISIFLHMFLGSVIAVMGIAIPAFIIFAKSCGINPLVPALFVYTAIGTHYILPFHHLNILVGMGKENGNYSEKSVIKLGIPLTAVSLITVVFEYFWWQLTGLI